MKTLLMTTMALGAVLTLGASQPAQAAADTQSTRHAVASSSDKAQIQDVRHWHRDYYYRPYYRDYYYRDPGAAIDLGPLRLRIY